MTTAIDMTQSLKNLFHSQLDACTQEYHQALMEKFGDKIDSQELLDTLNRVRGTQELDLTKKTKPAKKPKEPKEPKAPKTKELKNPESLCQARTWGDGSGECRCSFAAGPNGLCTKHAKQELECAVPCSTTDNGHKRLGLFMGRINQWQDGVEGILPYKDELGLLRIVWPSDHMKAIIRTAIEDGTCKYPVTGYGSLKTTSKKSAKSAKVAELVAIVDMPETSPEPAAEPETSSKPAAKPETSSEPATEPETSPEPAAKPETSSEPAAKQETSSEPGAEPETSFEVPAETRQTLMEELFGPDSNEEEEAAKPETSLEPAAEQETTEEVDDDEVEANVEEKIHHGKTWVVDSDDQTIYFWDEDDERHGANIGKWTEDGPELNEEWKWMLDL